MIRLWKKKYVLRMYERQTVKNGYAVAPSYKDKEVLLDVQPQSSQINNLPEGDREVKSLRSFGDFPIQTADARQYYRADRLLYDGEWYECTSCQWYEHTPVRHWECTFLRVPESDITNAPPAEVEPYEN